MDWQGKTGQGHPFFPLAAPGCKATLGTGQMGVAASTETPSCALQGC